MAQRFAFLADYLICKGYPIELLTTRSLLDHLRITPKPTMRIIEDQTANLPWASYLMMGGIIASITAGRYSRVHIAGGGMLVMPALRAAKISQTEKSVTFASRTLEMAAYEKPEQMGKWRKILDASDFIDVLNPGHNLAEWEGKISVSPGSFPSRYIEIPRNMVTERSPVVVFCGALEKTKNPILAVEAFSIFLSGDTHNAELVMFGRGSLYSEVQQRMEALNHHAGYEAARFGPPEEYFATLAHASVFLSLQDYDNYPSQSLMEAMALGCRCVATADGDTVMMFPDGGENIVLNSRQPHDFAHAISFLIADRTASFINAEHIQANHSIETFSRYFLNFLGINVDA
ncbi:MAG TPA: glycosyltransferase [Bellilinea sp.]|nr:glycosyltransferase [Bellilinea sp.]